MSIKCNDIRKHSFSCQIYLMSNILEEIKLLCYRLENQLEDTIADQQCQFLLHNLHLAIAWSHPSQK